MKETMKDTIEKIKEGCEKNKIEVILMAVFVCLALILNRAEIAEEAAALLGRDALVEETELQTESELQTEREFQMESALQTELELQTETETETEPVLTEEEQKREGRRQLSQLGADFQIPMRMPVSSAPESGSETLTEEAVAEHAEAKRIRELFWEKGGLPGYEMLTTEAIEANGLIPEDADWELICALEEGTSLVILEKKMTDRISEFSGEWSVYVKNLNTDESFVINDKPMKSASVMKLFIMGTVYEAFESGELEQTEEIMALVNSMITYSDNSSSNQLLYLLGDSSYEAGIAKVDEFIREYGFSDMTIEYNGFNDPATNTGTGNYNQVAAKDCGKLLEDIYRRTWVNREVSNEMEAMLLAQNTRYKIPAGLPDGVLCGNKTGEMDSTENDAAIIYSENCDYILVVLSSDWDSKDGAISRIAELSAMTYEFLNMGR